MKQYTAWGHVYGLISTDSDFCPKCQKEIPENEARIVIIYGNRILSQIDCKRCPGCGHFVIDYNLYRKYSKYITCLNDIELYETREKIKRLTDQNRKKLVYKHTSPPPCFVVKNLRETKKCKKCNANLVKQDIRAQNNNKFTSVFSAKYCKQCKIFYLRYTDFSDYSNRFRCLNPDPVRLSTKKNMQFEDPDINGIPTVLCSNAKEMISEKGISANSNVTISGNHKNNSELNSDSYKKQAFSNHISLKTFLIKRNVFHCITSDHSLVEITAEIYILNKKGFISLKKVPAGYCEDCGSYYILERTYKSILKHGVPLCPVVDEKNYNKTYKPSSMNMRPESILKQYGYTVSEQIELSSAQRHGILAILIDFNILTKGKIISYLDSFITLRSGQEKYEIAIDKWEEDISFVNNYRKDDFKKEHVGKLILT